MSTPAQAPSSGDASAPQTRYRKITACLRCRDRKKKCDRKYPVCLNCHREGKECIYANDSQQLKEHKQRLHRLNKSFAERLTGADKAQENPELNPLIVADPAYEDDADDDAADVGIRCGKLRISDRIGGMVRPRMVEELDYMLQISHDNTPSLPKGESLPDGTYKYRNQRALREFLAPGPSYSAPSSSAFWPSNSPENLLDMLPDGSQCQLLLDQYWLNVHPVARVLHRPTFEKSWAKIWQEQPSPETRPASLVALVAAIMLSSMISLDGETVRQIMHVDKRKCEEKLKAITERALSQAKWLRTSKVETLQALAIFLIPLCRAEVSRLHSNFVAAAIRAAEGLGLHVDGITRGYSPVQVHVRRLLWYQLSLLDIRTCEATGPRPQMRLGDFDTKLPVNLDDVDIENSPEESYTWTEMTVTIIRIKCNEFIRKIWYDRRLLQSKQITITEVLLSIENFYQEMDRKYGRMAQQDTPLHRYGVLLYKIQILRTFAMVLHQYHLHPQVEMSDGLKHIFIMKGIDTMEAVMEFETTPGFGGWHWLAGAIQQHHYALALLMELLLHPQRKDGPRILRGLDYVFEPPNLPPLERIRAIVSDIRDRMWFYMEAKKLRAPVSLMEKLRLGRDISEPSDESSSAEQPPSPDETAQSLMQHSEHESGESLSDAAALRESMPFHARSPETAGASIGPKDLMDLDWNEIGNMLPGPDQEGLDMSSEHFSLTLSTGAYPPQISQHNRMPAQSEPNAEYNYYSPLPAREETILPGTVSNQQAQQVSNSYNLVHGYASHMSSSFQALASYPYGRPRFGYSDPTSTFVPPTTREAKFHEQSTSALSNSHQAFSQDCKPVMELMNTQVLQSQTISSGEPVNTQSAAQGFVKSSDNEQNFGMGLYRPIPHR